MCVPSQKNHLVGKGSYDEVVEAMMRDSTSPSHERRCAIKQMVKIFDDKTDAIRTYREIHILRQLDHPNIISLYDVMMTTVRSVEEATSLLDEEAKDSSAESGTEPTDKDNVGVWQALNSNFYKTSPLDRVRQGDLYLVFEYMDTDLQKIMRSSQFMTKEHVIFIMYQLLIGLKYLHSANVIHRDLKPANVLINCGNCKIKIADFGLSRVVQPDLANDGVQLHQQVNSNDVRNDTIPMKVSSETTTHQQSQQ